MRNEKEKQLAIDNFVFSWDQMPGESDISYKLFLLYLNIGKVRNYRKAADLCERSYGFLCMTANQFMWKKRADEHDLYRDREMMVELDAEILKNKLLQFNLGKGFQELAQKGSQILFENLEDLTPADITKLADVGTKLTNLAMGSATEITESKVEAKVAVEVIPPEIAAEIGKKLAIQISEGMEVNI